nr:hypothetical protein [Candidatus Njordarchaeum guaymaensis]
MHKKRTIKEVVREVADIFNRLHIEYAIVGGVAVSAWGNIRTTVDIDVVIDLNEENVQRLVYAFNSRGFSVREEDILPALKEKGHFTIFDNRSDYHIDAKGAYGETELETLRARRKVVLADTECYVAAPEDMIANKLLYGSEQDLNDAVGIYVRQVERLDMKELRNLCTRLGVLQSLLALEKRINAWLKEAKPTKKGRR